MNRSYKYAPDIKALGGGKRSPAFTIEEAAVRLQTTGLPHPSLAWKQEGFPLPQVIGRGKNRGPRRYRLDELEAWLIKKGAKFVPYKIERGVPLPRRGELQSKELLETLQKMEPGDSLHIGPEDEGPFASLRCNYFVKGTFATRKEGDGRRIWKMQG